MRQLRLVLLLALVAAVATPALALPRALPAGANGPTLVQDRLLPRFFGGNEERRERDADLQVRIDQLEAQVRALTGQVEELSFAVRRLEEALAGGAAVAQPQGGLPPRSEAGPGAPPRDLGTLPVSPGVPAGGTLATTQGPIDLSVLNEPVTDPATRPTTAAPVTTDALGSARSLFQSGRYARAAEEARAVLASNPRGQVAGEARFLLGEALLAQGQYRDAANLFLENYTSDPNGARAPASLLRLGTALNGLGEREAACSSLEELFGAYPNVDPALRAAAEQERRTANCA